MNKLDLEETTRRFHDTYEQVAREYGYNTREDTKELDFNSPNGMTMLKTVEMITTPYLEEIERLKQDNEYLNKVNIELSSRNNKAIEYITTEQLYTNYQWGKSQYVKILKDLLDILKGSNKE